MLTPEQVREIRSLLYSECSKADYYDALSRLLDDRAEIAAALNEVRSLMHSDAVMSGHRWYFSSARGERVNQVCGQVVDVLRRLEGAPAGEK